MPSDLTISKLEGTTTPNATTREERIAAAHRKVGAYEEIYPNVYGDEDNLAEVREDLKLAGMGLGAAAIGGVADLVATGVAIADNVANMARGERWAWPEDFRNVPATSDWWGAQMGLTKEQTDSLAFIGGSLATIRGAADEKLLSKSLKVAKAFKDGTRGGAIANMKDAENLLASGLDENEIWKRTGWWPYKRENGVVDWKFYVSDADANIRYDRIGELTRTGRTGSVLPTAPVGTVDGVPMLMKDILDHPALYELYPGIGEYPIMVNIEKIGEDSYRLAKTKGGAVASFNPIQKRFQLKGSTGHNDARESLLHEVQHAIQEIEGWQGGASLRRMQGDIENYHILALMNDIYRVPEQYLDVPPEDIFDALKKVGLDEEQARILTEEAKRAIGSDMPEEVFQDRFDYWQLTQGQQEARIHGWLKQVVEVEGVDGLDRVLDALGPERLNQLAHMRYFQDLGELEARIVQAMNRIPQETINKLAINPHKFQQYLQGKQLQRVKEEVPEARRMEWPTPIEDVITDESRAVVQKRGTMDLQ